jgi:anti-sigma28 factor (negative regulator of flagellin synthesis)
MSVRGPSDVAAARPIENVKARASSTPSARTCDAERAAKPEDVVVSAAIQASNALASQAETLQQVRVAQIRAQIEARKYVIDRAKLAQRLLDEELERLGAE